MKISYNWYLRDEVIGSVILVDEHITNINESAYEKYSYPNFKYKCFSTEEEAIDALNEYLNEEYTNPYKGIYVLLKEFIS